MLAGPVGRFSLSLGTATFVKRERGTDGSKWLWGHPHTTYVKLWDLFDPLVHLQALSYTCYKIHATSLTSPAPFPHSSVQTSYDEDGLLMSYKFERACVEWPLT